MPGLRFAATLAACALIGMPLASGAQSRGVAPDFDAYVARAMHDFEVPGLAIAIVKDGHVVAAKGYGVRTLGSAAPVDAHTLFQIASNTKAFTTAALSTLVDEGKLRWDDRATKYLPWFELSDPYVTRELTVRDLLTHRSGLGLGAGDLLWFHSDYSADEILHRIRYARVATSFRSAYAYDNVLYVAAGRVIPAASGGTSWADFVRSRILTPLGMSETYTGITATPANAPLATPHAKVDGKVVVVARDSADVTSAAGAIVSNVTDLAKWMTVQLDSGRIGDHRVWSQARTRDMWTGVTILPIGTAPPGFEAVNPTFSEYGLGWFLRDYRGHKLVTHTGGLAGMTSRTLLVPDAKLGIVVLTNSESSISTAIAFRALDDMLGTPRLDWATMYNGLERGAEASAAEIERKAAGARDTASRPSLALAKYAGRYTDTMYGDATITLENGSLVLRFAHSPAFVGDMQHWQYDTFVAHWRTKNIPDAYVTFALTPQGTIDTMKMAAVSPLADFSFDYQDLLFKRPAP